MTGESILEELIVGRVPHIYAFETGTIPSYLKVGDTNRPVSMRLNEWRRYFKDLVEMTIADNEARIKGAVDVYFRDYSVHRFLEFKRKRERLKPESTILVGKKDAEGNPLYFSSEFFKKATPSDVQDGIYDIREAFSRNVYGDYQFYDASKINRIEHHYSSSGAWKLRPNQEAAVNAFKKALQHGETKLLMYAVMRFGKSFTSMYCAHVMNGGRIDKPLKSGQGAKLVVVVSGKKDVLDEWKKTVESPENFRNDYKFITSEDLAAKPGILKSVLSSKAQQNRAVVFLTLQDLAGNDIKYKHKELFGEKVDLLIVDETHFAARADVYGKVLQDPLYEKDTALKKVAKQYDDGEDGDVETDDACVEIGKTFKAKVRLHLSGTPYRILMGSEFKGEQIISFCQFSDIVAEQEKWDRDHLFFDETVEKKEDGTPWVESDNPYFGFPQMIRFAFTPNESSMQKLEELRKNGVTYAFSALFRPMSIEFDEKGAHKKFKYERQVLELLEVIDGSRKDRGLLGFLDYPKIKDGQMCRHIVCVLPYCASCDAMEALIKKYKRRFKNLKDYAIINISGVADRRTYAHVGTVKKKIEECEDKHKKTLTLTVNRMLTGSTVREWDTMLYFKDTESPQEYDQAIFRLQNQYVNPVQRSDGKTVSVNMKPQTLLVDFDPNRMFRLQELRSHIYNVNTDQRAGNDKLEERIEEELRISPVVWVNAEKLARATATNIMDAVRQYSSERGIKEEAREIVVDINELKSCPHLFAAVKKENPIGEDAGISERAYKEGNTPLDGLDDNHSVEDEPDDDDSYPKLKKQKTLSEDEIRLQQFQSYLMRILFFAYLTESDNVTSLARILGVIAQKDNVRIAAHLQLRAIDIIEMRTRLNQNLVREIDYRVRNMCELSHDKKFCAKPEERAERSIRKVGKLGNSIVVTPNWICRDMVALIPDKAFHRAVKNHEVFLDINGKVGEFATALYRRFMALGYKLPDFKDLIYTIPATMREYEFTLKVYRELGLCPNCIAEKFDVYSLFEKIQSAGYEEVCRILRQKKPFDQISLKEVVKGGCTMKVCGIVGNPPYHEADGGNKASAVPIYQEVYSCMKCLSSQYISMIIPAKWFTGGRKVLDDFRELMLADDSICNISDFPDSEDCFPGVDVAGGVCYFLRDSAYHGICNLVSNRRGHVKASKRNLSQYRTFVRYDEALSILEKIKLKKEASYESKVSSQKPFGLRTYVTPTDNGDINLRYSGGIGPFKSERVTAKKEWVDKFKVIMSYLTYDHAGRPDKDGKRRIFSTMEILPPKVVCTETYIVVGVFDNRRGAENLIKYLKTRFVRFLVSLISTTQHISKNSFSFVPVQDFEKEWTDEKLYAKYGITKSEQKFIESLIKPME